MLDSFALDLPSVERELLVQLLLELTTTKEVEHAMDQLGAAGPVAWRRDALTRPGT